MEKQIKVVWLCHFSNPFVHEKLRLQLNPIIRMLRKMAHKEISTDVPEFANWISNGICEFEKIEEVELHIVSPYPNLKSFIQEFTHNNIRYHFFRNEDDTIIPFIFKRLFHPSNYRYRQNRKTVSRILKKIKPEVVHLFGAENPDYGLGLFSTPKNAITIAQLQTLMNEPSFKDNYPIDKKSYEYRARVEKEILLKADYLCTPVMKYRQIILDEINPNAIILNAGFALKDPVVKESCEKKYDFVYFAANISKAADVAIEAFGIAYQTDSNITLDVIGEYSEEYMRSLRELMKKYGISNVVTFEGLLPTHDDVLKQIRKSRFALLPLKVDLISGTIKEAMSNGLPVITSDTGEQGTQKLNLKRRNVLLSPIGDCQTMAENMLLLSGDDELAETLRQNAFQTRLEVRSNQMVAKKYVDNYNACLENYWDNRPIPTELTAINNGVGINCKDNNDGLKLN